jgi:hypothetical protein
VGNRDPGLDTLLLLDGETFVADLEGKYWVKFIVKKVPASVERPHGLAYSLTLHGEDGERLLGFDNAHQVRETLGPGAGTRIEYDHQHRGGRANFYIYTDAAAFLAAFWTEVERIMHERSQI